MHFRLLLFSRFISISRIYLAPMEIKFPNVFKKGLPHKFLKKGSILKSKKLSSKIDKL